MKLFVFQTVTADIVHFRGRGHSCPTSARPTSGAIHSIDVNGKNLRYVTDGNEYHIINSGHYKGDLIVNQHRYRFHPMGSYDWDWLFTPQGNQIKLYKKENY